MPAWTEEASFPTAPESATVPSSATGSVSIAGVPYVTILTLGACAWILLVSGGLKASLSLPVLLVYGAKATPLILDRGETWRLFAANFLHKDILHLAFNAFAIWNVGGALERAVRPADYLTLIISTALGTTLMSAIAADSISLGASGIAFGLLAAACTFGWRRGVRGQLRSYFGLRMVPWMLALFAAGVGSAGVDNWGHAGGLVTGGVLGFFLCPRGWSSDAPSRRLAAAIGALLGTLALGVLARPVLPLLGSVRDGPPTATVRMPLGWRRTPGEPGDRAVFSNGLTGVFRSSATVVQLPGCTGKGCECEPLVRDLVENDVWRNADLGPPRKLVLGEPVGARSAMARVDGILTAEDGAAELSAICLKTAEGPLAILVLQPPGGCSSLVQKMAESAR
jgi:membrane associated rhomboid family serine protease